MKKNKLSLFCALFLIACLLLASCGASHADEADNGLQVQISKGEYGYADSYYSKDMAGIEEIVESLESPNYANGATTAGGNQQITDYAEKIIRNVSMVAETREFDRTLAEIRAAALALGGYEQSVNTTGRSYNSSATYRRTANMVLRIPAEHLEDFLGSMGNLVNITSQSASASNVTTEYYDIQSRIKVLQSEKQAYEEMLQKSEEVEHLLKIKDRLYDVIAEIESYETQIRMYDSKVAYSTVTMRLEEVVEYSPVVTPKDTFGTRISNAFTRSWHNFADGFQSFVVWFISAIPTILVLAVIGGGITSIVIITTRRAKARATRREKNGKEDKE